MASDVPSEDQGNAEGKVCNVVCRLTPLPPFPTFIMIMHPRIQNLAAMILSRMWYDRIMICLSRIWFDSMIPSFG